ncbi:DUF922 domain-containing Zn-dependent protease [Endozoicomonas arenosclerae]|uniref:DUF922 domain-containing Zn-dependent protease n=1 Tax=Endozoicomonas arenosclerae TaxID=1633495 RepID=UPI000780EB25|nr:DUF922 domain-containing Zn-dependent protease [Endozoicomonas arenosclerae]
MHRITHFLFFLLLPTATLAVPVVETSTEYYEVQGSSPYELRQQLNERSPVIDDGERFDASTKWDVRWHFEWAEANNQCRIKAVTSRLEVKFTLPEWINRDSARKRLREKWDRYFTALQEHESGHKAFGFEAATEIEQAIASMKPETSCQKLEKKANELGDSIINQYVEKEIKYDRITRHGLDQGASFP